MSLKKSNRMNKDARKKSIDNIRRRKRDIQLYIEQLEADALHAYGDDKAYLNQQIANQNHKLKELEEEIQSIINAFTEGNDND